MLRDKLINTAMRFGIDEQLRCIRNSLPFEKHSNVDEQKLQKLRLLLASILTVNSNCIDIGGFRGRVLAEMVRLAPHGQHIAYEPQPDKCRSLIKRFPSVDVRQAALSNEEGETSFVCVKNIPGYSGFRETPLVYPKRPQIERLTVRTEMLDKSLPSGYVPALISIDVEGAEGLVFEGALKTITLYKPIIIFEHGKTAVKYFSTSSRRIYELLHDVVGLLIFDLDGNGPYTADQLEETCSLGLCQDFVARPCAKENFCSTSMEDR